MAKPKLFYFDAPVSRGEECRLALHVAGVDFDDVRVKREEWPALKPTMPFGAMPVLELPGRAPLAQTNAILVFLGRQYGLHPADNFEAARHEAMMCHVEDLRGVLGPTMRIKDEAEKKAAREALAASQLPTWAERAEKQIGDGPFFAGPKLHVVDLKLYSTVRWLASGKLDYIPATILSAYAKLNRVHDAVRDDQRVKAWYAKG
jgi:prostaglandin-H2 D-isomerase / glutathione transferase